MNTKDEIVAAMNGENVDSPPPALFSQTGTISMMESSGARWPEANYNEDLMIELALQPSKQFGFATIRIPFDITAEAEAIGCTIDRGSNARQPAVSDSPWRTGEVGEPPDLIPVEEFLAKDRCSMYIRTAERISKEHPELFLTSCVVGPLELANYMVGMENFIMASFMDMDSTVKWVEKVTPYQCAYAEALSEFSDNLFVITEGAEDIFPPEMFDAYAPSEKKLYSSIKDSFSTAHVCGQTSNVLEPLAGLGPTALSVQCFGDPQEIYDRVGGKVILVGGVDPIDVLMQGKPEDIVLSSKKAAAAGYSVITPECGVPPQTPDANLKALAGYRGC
jgi:[methyl-Co(III) methanol-specific corrinoid protein]:coenzyme M methyltransferase